MRTITKGDPQKIAQKMGEARNLMSRSLAKQVLDGNPQSRVSYNGTEVRLNANGIDQIIIDAPAESKPTKSEFVTAPNPLSKVLVYAVDHLSATSNKTLAERSMRYWSAPLHGSILDFLLCKTIVIADPQRPLFGNEARILKLLMSKGRKVFVFPGADTASYNAILLQLESNLHLIPTTTKQVQMTTFTPDTQIGYRLPALLRGFLQPIKDHTLTPVISDPFGKMMATSDVVLMTPAYYVTRTTYGDATPFVYAYGSELLAVLESDNGIDEGNFGSVTLTFTRNQYISETLYPDDWSTLSETDFENWLHTLDADFFREIYGEYTFARDANGWLTYEERAIYDSMGAYAAYEVGTNLYTFGYSPYWMITDYDQKYDDQADVKAFCKWMESPQESAIGVFGDVFYPVHPFFVAYDIYGIGGYIPPIQY